MRHLITEEQMDEPVVGEVTAYEDEPGYEDQPEKPRRQPLDIGGLIVSLYLMPMFGFFTFYLSRQNYSTARHDKFYLYLALTGALTVAAAGWLCYSRFFSPDRLTNRRDNPLFKPVSVTDVAVLSFVIFAAISAFCSAYYPETLIAEIGRNNGLVLLVFYALMYFIISRLYAYWDYVIVVFLIASCAVALLTILNFFYIDPLHLLTRYDPVEGIIQKYDAKTAANFGSTIGNKNTIASYMALFLPFSMMTLVLNKKLYMRVIAGVSIVFAYAGALCANSSSVFLGLFVAIPVMAIFCAGSYDRITRYMLALTILFASGKLLRLFSCVMEDQQKGFEGIQNFLIYNSLSFVPIVVCGAITLALYLLRRRLQPHYPAKAVTITLIVLTGAAVAGMIGALVYFSAIDTTSELGESETLLRFNDRWGTHRGFMWIRSVEEYRKFGFFQKLFGAGPDMTYHVLEPYFDELLRRFSNSSTNCAHNEFLNYLITQGALGLLSYLAIIGSVCVRSFRRARENPTALIFISAVICYAVQSTVNIYQPITTPLFFIFISIAEALNRKTPPFRRHLV